MGDKHQYLLGSPHRCVKCGMLMRWYNSKFEWSSDGIEWSRKVKCVETNRAALIRLAHNLAIAGGLCAAFRHGHGAGCIAARAIAKNIAYLMPWEPGCNRPAPGVGE